MNYWQCLLMREESCSQVPIDLEPGLGNQSSPMPQPIKSISIFDVIDCSTSRHRPPLLISLLYTRNIMASSLRPMVRLTTRPQSFNIVSRPAASQFHTSRPTNATPAGPPPTGFRLPKPKRYDEGESSLNKASNYFLLTEIFRGMYVVLEQYFRPP